MFSFTTLGAKIMLFVSLALAAAAIYFPFLEGFALTPAIAFIHRFSITLGVGETTKTIQPLIFVIPILAIKGLLEYHKRYHIKSLLKTPILPIFGLILLADAISLGTTTSRSLSISTFIVHVTNLAVFFTSSMWLRIVSDTIDKEKAKKVGITLIKRFAVALAIFSVINSVLSITQFVDCSGSSTGCHVWSAIDKTFPNKLLDVGHQKFSESPIIIRAVGLFGDVNFNGMVSLLVLGISLTLLLTLELLKKDKGFNPVKEQKLLLIPIAASIISYLLTISRSAVFGFLGVGIAVILFVFIPILKVQKLNALQTRQITRWSIIAFTAIVLVFSAGFLIPLKTATRATTVSGEIVRYVKTIISPSEDSSANGHVILLKSAIVIGNQQPLTGMGMGTFSKQYDLVIEHGNTYSNPHSTYGLLYAEQGLIGLGLYAAAIIYLWYLAIKQLRKVIADILLKWKENKRPDREFYIDSMARLFIALIAFGVPFFSLATITYYGFFLPMTWWWGSKAVVEK